MITRVTDWLVTNRILRKNEYENELIIVIYIVSVKLQLV